MDRERLKLSKTEVETVAEYPSTLLTGTSGSGKTTVGKAEAKRLQQKANEGGGDASIRHEDPLARGEVVGAGGDLSSGDILFVDHIMAATDSHEAGGWSMVRPPQELATLSQDDEIALIAATMGVGDELEFFGEVFDRVVLFNATQHHLECLSVPPDHRRYILGARKGGREIDDEVYGPQVLIREVGKWRREALGRLIPTLRESPVPRQ
jgi:hypothetical protein